VSTSIFASSAYLVVVGRLQDLGWNFVDPIPSKSNLVGARVDENPTGLSSISKSPAVTILPGAFSSEIVQYIEYVPRPVSQAPRSTSKGARVDDASASASATKKPCPSSTHLGTQVIGITLLGERSLFSFDFPVRIFTHVLPSL
jgi:hypothetical protein